MTSSPFSKQLEDWLNGKQPKTISSLEKVFSEKSFATVVLVLMFIPALPIPTGGITHIFEIFVMLIGLEMLVGIDHIWLPEKWKSKHIKSVKATKAISFIIRNIRWFEKLSRPRLRSVLTQKLFLRFTGIVFFSLALTAFLAVPFSGLDTLPSLAAVVVSLALLLDDVVIYLIGLVIGAVGIGLVVSTGLVAGSLFGRFF